MTSAGRRACAPCVARPATTRSGARISSVLRAAQSTSTARATARSARAASDAAASATAAAYVSTLTQDCPQPRTGGRRGVCERCGSTSHPETSCPTLWRIYTYNTPEEHAARRAKRARHLERRAERKAARTQRRDKHRAGWAAALVQPSDSSGPSDSSDDEAPSSPPPSDWDPALAWCYNCGASGHHWGDDCFLRRTNPTRPTGEPSPFSEALAASGPFAHPRERTSFQRGGGAAQPPPPLRRRRSEGGFLPRPSLLEDMERDEDDTDWFARRQALRQPMSYDSPARDRGRSLARRLDAPRGSERARDAPPSRGRPFARGVRPRSTSPPPRRVRRGKGARPSSPFRPHYRGGYT